jgi:nudix-type nucleoside diphosphatase (YffH/AdpP family)
LAHPRVRILSSQVLADDWAKLTKYRISYQRADGVWEEQVRQAYDRGDGACLLPYDPARGTVLLVRQFRFPAYIMGDPEPHLIEACAGLLDRNDPETAIVKEAEEELGIRVRKPRLIFSPYMSPGSVTERLYFFVAEYSAADRISAGGGLAHEGENIDVLELPLDKALAMIDAGEIADAKTIMLLQCVKLKGLIG